MPPGAHRDTQGTLGNQAGLGRLRFTPEGYDEFAIIQDEEPEATARQRQILRQQMRGLARQAALDPGDDLGL